MDRDDARLVANALEGRISGERALLERLAASSLMQLSAIAATITRRNTDQWPPARIAGEQLMRICRLGGAIVDEDLDGAQVADLEQFIACMKKLAAEKPAPIAILAPFQRPQRLTNIGLIH